MLKKSTIISTQTQQYLACNKLSDTLSTFTNMFLLSSNNT